MSMSRRAYSLLEIKSVDDDKHIIFGTATTPETDIMDDVVEPDGAEFKLPIPFLWQHDSDKPIGYVTKAKVTSKGIDVEIPALGSKGSTKNTDSIGVFGRFLAI